MRSPSIRRPEAAIAAALLALLNLAPTRAGELMAIRGSNELVSFNSATPGTITGSKLVTGLQAGEILLAIDRRPSTDALYALGSSNRIYVIDAQTGIALAVGPVLDIPLTGSSYGFDFSPNADRIRINSDAEINFRVHPGTGVVVDANPGMAGTQPDTPLSPAGDIVGAAYDRVDIDPLTASTLYVIDSGTDQLLTQGGIDGTPSQNGGVLTPIGALGINITSAAGFDIDRDGQALAVLNVGVTSALYAINLGSGAATLIGNTGVNGLSGLAASDQVFLRNGFE